MEEMSTAVQLMIVSRIIEIKMVFLIFTPVPQQFLNLQFMISKQFLYGQEESALKMVF